MDLPTILLLAGLLIFAAYFFTWLFSFTRIPDVLLLIIVGIIAGPVLGFIPTELLNDSGGLFSLLVLAIILFVGGTQLRLDVLSRSLRGSTSLTFLSFFATMVLVGLLVWVVVGVPFILALAFGAIVGGTSSAVVIPMLQGITAGEEAEASLAFESALSDVLSVVITTALLAALAGQSSVVTGVAWSIVVTFLGAAAIGLIGGLVWSLLLGGVRQLQHSMLTTPAFMLVLFGIAEALGVSGPIAALAFGITMGNAGYFKLWLENHHRFLRALFKPVTLDVEERSFLSEVVFLLQIFFFVFVGVSIPFENVGVMLFALAVTVTIFLIRIPVVRMTSPKDMPSNDRMYLAGIAPKGLAATVLATLLVQGGFESAEFLRDAVYLVIFISILFTSVLVFLVSRTRLGAVYQRWTGGQMAPVPPQNPPLPEQ